MFLVGDGIFGFAHTVERGIEKAWECDLVPTERYFAMLREFEDAVDRDDFETLNYLADELELVSNGRLEWNDGDLFWVE